MATKVEKGLKSGKNLIPLTVPCIEIEQSAERLYLFSVKASRLYRMLSINRRIEDKDEGYQRTLSISSVEAISKHILKKKTIPIGIVVSLEKGTYAESSKTLRIPAGKDVGWVIDGQHRLVGAHLAAKAGLDIQIPVVAFIGLKVPAQIEQFVTINREAKGVPTSLYLDLLGKLPNKKPQDAAKERAVDIATELRKIEGSPFYERIVVTTAPKDGQISLTNFVRKVTPHVLPDKGILHIYTEKEQLAVVSNYFQALQNIFPSEYGKKDSMFFKTIGFGALWNAFHTFFSLSLTNYSGFEVKDATRVFKKIENFDFSAWKQQGTGNQAEMQAGEDLKTSLLLAFQSNRDGGKTLRV